MKRSAALGVAVALIGLSAHAQAPTVAPAVIDYTLKDGDTLTNIAVRYLAGFNDYRVVAKLNGVRRTRRMQIGQVVKLPVDRLKSTPIQARIANFRGAVTVEQGGARGGAVAGQMLDEGAVIATGPNAFVRLTLSDGGHVSLPSQTRVRVARLRSVVLTGAVDQAFEVLSGRAESDVAPVKPTGSFSVRTPISVSAVRGTEFRVSFDPERNRSSTEVIKGVVGVEAGSQTVLAEQAQGVSAGPTGARLAALLAAPELVSPDAPQTGETVAFDIAALPGAAFYRARLATDAGMIDAIAEADSPDGGRRIVFSQVAEGGYFVRLSAVSADGVEGLATAYAFYRARNGIGGLGAGAQGRQYLFRWEAEGEGEARFRFELRGPDAAAPPLFDLADLTDPRVTLTGLPPGTYAWRVRITRRSGDRVLETWSPPQQLRIGR